MVHLTENSLTSKKFEDIFYRFQAIGHDTLGKNSLFLSSFTGGAYISKSDHILVALKIYLIPAILSDD